MGSVEFLAAGIAEVDWLRGLTFDLGGGVAVRLKEGLASWWTFELNDIALWVSEIHGWAFALRAVA